MEKKTALQTYLTNTNRTQLQFARELAERLGRRSVPIGQVSRYARGLLRPGPSMRIVIDQLTGGAVGAGCWPELRAGEMRPKKVRRGARRVVRRGAQKV